MSDNYNLNNMSSKVRVICERGKFFIETGTAEYFKQFLYEYAMIVARYTPEVVVKRIEDLINSNDRDSAVTLWMKTCENADIVPIRNRKQLMFYIYFSIIGIIATIALLRTL